MKSVSRLAMIAFVTAVAMTSCEKGPKDKWGPGVPKENDLSYIHLVVQPQCGGELVSDLLAGKNTRVGVVRVTTDGEYLTVKYEIEGGGWLISETHLSVTASLAEVPAGTDLNPKTGLFEYKTNHDPYVSSYTYSGIPVNGNKQLYILAHAVVERVTGWQTNLEQVSIILPDYVNMSVSYPYTGASSYFTTTVTNGGILDGTYDGWCVDAGNTIYTGTSYLAEVISSYDETCLEGIVDNPANMDKVNWVMNQGFVGTPSLSEGDFTYGDVQLAIWALIDNGTSLSGVGPYSQARVDEILALAEDGGNEFIPECGQKLAIVLRPVDATGNPVAAQITIAQVTIITFPTVCVPLTAGDETAWAAGYDFGGSNWAKYFIYCLN
ncbi:MAG: thioester domain-containing protein [Bacteroidales bacterium]|jgi:hypothetical protein|nr:thioester domain-containing protein [Bacteroidales bacterium]